MQVGSKRYRPPVDLPQLDHNSCTSCVAAQILYMSGRRAQPDVAAVDRAVGRVRNEIADHLEIYYMLLRNGMQMHSICSYDRERLFREGLPYLRHYYRKDWGPEWEAYFTPDWFARQREYYTRLRRANTQYRRFEIEERRDPTVFDIMRLIQSGWLAWVTVGYEESLMSHTALIYAMDGVSVRLYYPDTRNTLRSWNRSVLARLWRPREGVIGVRPVL
jgi:hypothetical protein